LKKIIAQSYGIPRIINILCDNALITGFGYQKERISVRVAKEVIADFKGHKSRGPLKWVFAVLSSLLMAGIFSVLVFDNSLFRISGVGLKFFAQEKQVSQNAYNTSRPQALQAVGTAPARLSVGPHEETMPDPIRHSEFLEEKKETFPIIRTVRKGDNLFRLVREIYSYNDEKLINLVMQNNSGITSSDKILVGDEIIFPAMGEKRKDQWAKFTKH